MDEKFGPWVVWGKRGRPKGLRDSDVVQVVRIDGFGELRQSESSNSVIYISWSNGVTLAYRVKIVEKEYKISGYPDSNFYHKTIGTHEITYVLDADGEVISCKMVKR